MSILLQVSDLRKYHLYRKETDMRKGLNPQQILQVAKRWVKKLLKCWIIHQANCL